MKTCSKCNITKPYTEFHKSNSTKDSYQTKCKLCRNEYYIDNENKIKQNSKQWKLDNPDYQTQWYIDNPDYQTQWRKDNPEKYNQIQEKWYKNNPEYMKQYLEQYAKTPLGKLVNKLKNHKRRASIKSNTPNGKHWTPEDIKLKFKLQHGKCVYCETSIKDYFEIDHFVPVSKNGSNEPSNIQLLCKPCNGKGGKGALMPDEFAKKYGKLF